MLAGLAVLSGAGLSVQSRINGELAHRLGSGLQAAVISFGSGLVVATALVLVVPSLRRALAGVPRAVRGGLLPWWCLLAGVGGGFFVGVQTLVVPVIGVALFTVAVVAGQTTNSLNVDRLGLGSSGATPVTTPRLAAALVAVVAVAVSVSDKLGSASFSLVAVLAGIVAGALIAVQQAFNGRVRVESGSALAATWVNFAVGTAVLVLALLVTSVVVGPPPLPWTGQPLWLYSGGVVGIAFIAASAFVVSRVGVLLFSLCQVAGQVVGALVVDLLAPVAGEQVTTATLVGAALTGVAVAVGAGVRPRRTTRV